MQLVYAAAGGADGLLRLASAWHARVMADDVVSHAFSHGYHPAHAERLAAYWAEALGGPTMYSQEYGDESSVVRSTAVTGHTRKWTFAPSPVSIRRLSTSASPVTTDYDRSCTTTSFGQPPPRCPGTTAPQTRCRTVSASRTGRGTDSSADPCEYPPVFASAAAGSTPRQSQGPEGERRS